MTAVTRAPADWRDLAARLLAATVIGITTGLVVLGFEHLVEDVLHEVFEAPVWVPAVVVFVGSGVTALVIRFLGGQKTTSTEVYVEQFHHGDPDMDLEHTPGRVFAAFTTLGSGAPLGLEGPAVYTGSAIATFIHRHWSVLRGDAFHALLVAGSAAGIAAVFKAPAAGAISAMEVPFHGRFAGERVLPAIFGAASGYLTMALVDGVESEIEVPLIELTIGRAFLSAVLGLVIGIAAIGVIWLVTTAERATSRWSAGVRAVVAGGALAGIYALGRGMTGESLALTSGNSVIDWAVKPSPHDPAPCRRVHTAPPLALPSQSSAVGWEGCSFRSWPPVPSWGVCSPTHRAPTTSRCSSSSVPPRCWEPVTPFRSPAWSSSPSTPGRPRSSRRR